jgi:hypothetical protein
MPTKNHKHIKTPNDLRVILSRAINLLLLDEFSHSTASALSSLASVMLKTLQATNLESRIAKLEEKQEDENTENTSPAVSDIQAKIRGLRN